jgi:ketosteroid isomerase-like protein
MLNNLALRLLASLLPLIFLSACNTNSTEATLNKEQELKAIQSLMSEQQDAWNNGDLEGYMKAYWHHDSLKFIGKRGITYGWQATLDNYKKGYSSREAMGRLQFTNLETDLLSDSTAFVIGKWQLFRNADTLAGYYTLLWKKLNNGWHIVADHSS